MESEPSIKALSVMVLITSIKLRGFIGIKEFVEVRSRRQVVINSSLIAGFNPSYRSATSGDYWSW